MASPSNPISKQSNAVSGRGCRSRRKTGRPSGARNRCIAQLRVTSRGRNRNSSIVSAISKSRFGQLQISAQELDTTFEIFKELISDCFGDQKEKVDE